MRHEMKIGAIVMAVVVAYGCALSGVQADELGDLVYQPVDFSEHHNLRIQGELYSGFPEGELVLGEIPFSIPEGGDNYWSSRWSCGGGPPEPPCDEGDNPRVIDIDVGKFAVQEVHTLINTVWGQPGPEAYAWLEFFGSDGAYFRKDLIGNEHVRDWAEGNWTNEIDGEKTINVFSENPDGRYERRLDKQLIVLPSEFQTQTLETITMTDVGGERFSRAFLYGVTVAYVPEPATALLLGLGLPMLMRRRR